MKKQNFNNNRYIARDRCEKWAIALLPISFFFGIGGAAGWSFWNLLKLGDELEEHQNQHNQQIEDDKYNRFVYEYNQTLLPGQKKMEYRNTNGKCWKDRMRDKGYDLR